MTKSERAALEAADLALNIISLGAGVQSSTMALMAVHGEITPMPDCAIFADTQWEPKQVYEWLTWLEKQLPFPVHRVTAGNIMVDQMTRRRTIGKMGRNPKTDRYASLPYFVRGELKIGKIKRQCTHEYKILPIETFIKREILGVPFRGRVKKGMIVNQWRGISTDEAHRMKPSATKWINVRYPLAMELRMSRNDCLQWMKRRGFPRPPRSACIGCPFHSDYEWLEIRKRPEEWNQAVAFDAAIRDSAGLRAPAFVHRDCVPLDEVQFRADRQDNLFGNECEGMCGV